MKTKGYRHTIELIEEIQKFQLTLPTGRIIIYSRSPSKHSIQFFLCFQYKIDAPSVYTVGGQKYLDKDLKWREPHGASSCKYFSSPASVIKYANEMYKNWNLSQS